MFVSYIFGAFVQKDCQMLIEIFFQNVYMPSHFQDFLFPTDTQTRCLYPTLSSLPSLSLTRQKFRERGDEVTVQWQLPHFLCCPNNPVKRMSGCGVPDPAVGNMASSKLHVKIILLFLLRFNLNEVPSHSISVTQGIFHCFRCLRPRMSVSAITFWVQEWVKDQNSDWQISQREESGEEGSYALETSDISDHS